MSMRGSGGGFVRDGATQTGRAVILIVVAIVVAVILLHHNGSTTAQTTNTTTAPTTVAVTTAPVPTTTATTTPPSTTPPSTVPIANQKVLVLNGADPAKSYASEFTTKVKGFGYTTLTPNNAVGTVKHSAIYVITAGFAPEAKTLADKLGLPASAVKTTVPSGPPLSSAIPASGANLVLVVGPDLASSATSGSSGTSSSGTDTTSTTA